MRESSATPVCRHNPQRPENPRVTGTRDGGPSPRRASQNVRCAYDVRPGSDGTHNLGKKFALASVTKEPLPFACKFYGSH